MGINGLLPMLKSITERIHISAYANQTVAIDAYSWLHRGAHFCAADLYHGRPTTAYVDYCMTWVRFLQSFAVKPLLVFDGGPLPMKRWKEQARHATRAASRQKIASLLEQRMDASTHYSKAVDVTPEMAHQLIKELRKARVPFVVAPYEADAQMAYLALRNRVAAIITEDSDLLLFSHLHPTPPSYRILFKLDRSSGFADGIAMDRLGDCKELPLFRMSHAQFRQMCMLSGCDYVASLPSVGLKSALTHMSRNRFDIQRTLDALGANSTYVGQFFQAEATFRHQTVFDMDTRKLCPLNPIETAIADRSFLGPLLSDEVAEGVAVGRLCPATFQPFDGLVAVEDENVPETPPSLPTARPLMLHKEAGRLTMKRAYATATKESRKKAASDSRKITDFFPRRPIEESMSHLPRYCFQGKKPEQQQQ